MKYRTVYIGKDFDVILRIDKTLAFPSAADTWTWAIKIDRKRNPSGTPKLTHDADSAVLSNGDKAITLTFNVSDTKAGALEAGRNKVDIFSDDGAGKTVGYPEVSGIADVWHPAGTA